MGVYQRPPRSDELYHWGKGSVAGQHKYIAKIGNRYFYTPEELKAFKQGVSGAGQKVSDNFNKLRSAVYDRAGGAAKRRAQASAKAANEAKNDVAAAREKVKAGNRSILGITKRIDRGYSAPNDYEHISKNRADELEKVRDTLKTSTAADQRRLNIVKNVAKNTQAQADRDRAAYKKTPLGRAEAVSKKVSRGKKKVMDYLEDRKRQQEEVSRGKREMDEAERRGDGSVKRISPGVRVKFSEPELGERSTTSNKNTSQRKKQKTQEEAAREFFEYVEEYNKKKRKDPF